MRVVSRVVPGREVMEGAGVKVRRTLGQALHQRLDPFLMLDEFFSDDPSDYIEGFPDHPHRGFETVTYMLVGRMLHRDHLGNRGDLGPGDVQWMTAGRGIIHSEMPQQTEGRMHGFQLWINLPRAEKMKPAGYRDIPAAEIPEVEAAPGVTVRLIAGKLVDHHGEAQSGPVAGLTTDPLYLDVAFAPGAEFSCPIADGYAAFVYPFQGTVRIAGQVCPPRSALLLEGDGELLLQAEAQGARCLVLAARPLGEPVVQYGPFVMTSREEIEQALADYRTGRLVS